MIWNHPLYLFATLLHPSYRTNYLESVSKSLRIPENSFLEKVRPIWLKWKRDIGPDARMTAISHQMHRHIEKKKKGEKPTIRDRNQAFLKDRLTSASDDEFEQYLKEPTLTDLPDTPTAAFNWWKQDTISSCWPLLSKLAITLFAIPTMSAEMERVFSTSRRTISWDRARLGEDIIEALEGLKYWYRQEDFRQSAEQEN